MGSFFSTFVPAVASPAPVSNTNAPVHVNQIRLKHRPTTLSSCIENDLYVAGIIPPPSSPALFGTPGRK